MQILVTDIIGTALITFLIAVFLFIDIITKNKLGSELRSIGSDMSIGAIAIQLAFTATLLTNQKMDILYENVAFSIFFTVLWVISIWLSGKKDTLKNMLSYTLGSFALSLAILQVLDVSSPIETVLSISASLIVSTAGFLFADYLNNERIDRDFLEILEKLNMYEMNDDYRKIEAGKTAFDPLGPAIDIIRGSIRKNEEHIAVNGIKALGTFGSDIIRSDGNNTLATKHLSAHLYELGILADNIDRTDISRETIRVLGELGYECAQRKMEKATMKDIEHLHNIFNVHKTKDNTILDSKAISLRKAKTMTDVYNILIGTHAFSTRHELVIAVGRIGQVAAKQEMVDALEKALELMKLMALDASDKDIQTLEHVHRSMVNIATPVRDKKLKFAEKMMIQAMRDVCIKAVQVSADKKKTGRNNNAHKEAVATLRDIGTIFGETSYSEITASLKDIGIAAARKHSDEKVSDVIVEIEHFCLRAADKKLKDEAALAIHSLAQVCEASMKEQMTNSTSLSSRTLADLSQRDELTIFVNDAVFEMAKYRELNLDMFTLFDRTYRNCGGR